MRKLEYGEICALRGAETLIRLNVCKTGFNFSGYRSELEGYVVLPVKFSKDEKQKNKQKKELQTLGYEPVTEEEQKMIEKQAGKKDPFYKISIEELVECHPELNIKK